MLATVAEQVVKVAGSAVALYDTIRAAKETGYSYNELELATGFLRGTLQNIVGGKNPRFSME